MTDDATYRKMKQERDLALSECERLRANAERYQWLAEYLVSDDESYDDAIVAATTVKEVDSVIDAARGKP